MSFAPSPFTPMGIRSIQEQRDRWERKRSCTARELVQSEQRYCEQLDLVVTYFVEILKAKGTLRQDIRESIFSSIKSIHLINQYKHFLRDLTENTSPDNPEFQQLSKAVKTISEVAQRIQDNARSHENHLQLRRVQKQLKGRKTRILTPGRWYIREGWLKTVPPKGTEAKPKMFYLFSDILLQAKPCSPIHPTNRDKFNCQRIYPLKECTVDKVFGHTKSQGGLISLTFARAKLLLMSDDQGDINDWYRSLCLAIGQLKSKNTVVHRRDKLRRKPIRSDPDSQNTQELQQTRGIKRTMMLDEEVREHKEGHSSSSIPSTGESGYSATKRLKPSEAPAARPQESSGSSCVIL
ncbi:rho guanine nucleotide exchange factor 39 isoform X2 [Cyprinus carpio]|uniref:Rho guanine nucleotide exchange factor 39 isoform X2 n=1 Tax=Cyprinus carpio TaxID=7962 RepID=A0A9Q9ZXP1_CYPCA|nr:rho guanine nucleotide exchange factor 39 isoform X2 [Cyprinus carpio]